MKNANIPEISVENLKILKIVLVGAGYIERSRTTMPFNHMNYLQNVALIALFQVERYSILQWKPRVKLCLEFYPIQGCWNHLHFDI
jgi:hypothetical protein